MANPTDTNQPSENELLKKIDSIMPQCGEIDCYTCTKRHKRVLELIRTEKLKLLAEVKEQIKAGVYDWSYEISVVDKLEAEL